MDVKLYLALAGSLGVAYVAYNLYSKPRIPTISKELTRRICQQIKHQMMIVCITYSKAMKKIREDNAQKIKGKEDQIFMNFRNQLSQVYVSKEMLILRKYAVTREVYGKALEQCKRDKLVLKNTEEILNMMQRAIQGELPDFTVPQQVYNTFSREQLAPIYRDMVTLIGKKVTHKLQEEVDRNQNFNPNSDEDFRNAIRDLGIYDIKVSFLKERGFKEEWGCPNEIFFKYLESEKSKDQAYEKIVLAYEKCYEKIIELVSLNPKKMTDRAIDEMFEKALEANTAPAKPAAQPAVQQPVRVAPVQPPKPFMPAVRAAKKPQPVDEDAELEAMMMKELLSRSQEPARSVSVDSSMAESLKLGMTSSEIQNDWEKTASLTEKPVNKLEEAVEEVAIGEQNEKLIKNEMRVVEEALKEQETEEVKPEEASVELGEESNIQEPEVQEPKIDVSVPPVIVDVETVVEQTKVVETVIVETVVVEAVVEEVQEAPVAVEDTKPEQQNQGEQEQQNQEQKEEAQEEGERQEQNEA